MTRLPYGRRRRARRGDPQLEATLRDSLREHATRAPDADDLTARILAAAEDVPHRGRRGADRAPTGADRTPARADLVPRGPWRTWGLAFVAAVLIAAVVGIGLAITSYDPDGHDQAADPSSSSAPPPLTSTRTVTETPQPSPTRTSVAGPTKGAVQADTSTLRAVQVLDLTFTGTDEGYGLASAECIRGSGRCVALIRTTDGTTWTSHSGTPFDVPGIKGGCPAVRCVEHIRFATRDVGYVYGPHALFLTTDGAQSWTRLSGGADALETLDGNVIRVSRPGSCTSGCPYTVQTAGVGSERWTTRTLPGPQGPGDGVVLARSGNAALLEDFGRPTGGAPSARAVLWSSSDDGASWTRAGEPCPQRGGEVDSVDLTPAPDGSFTVACRPRDGSTPAFTTTTADDARSFTRGAVVPGTAGDAPLVGAASRSTLLAATDVVHRSRDGGSTWHAVADGPTGVFEFVGFESGEVGRAVTDGGNVIWTTRDAGRNWQRTSLG